MNVYNTDNIRRRFEFNSPEQLEELFGQYPLDTEFIDWVHDLRFKIVHNPEMYKGGGFVNWDDRLITVSTKGGDSQLIKLITVHELVHIACGGREITNLDNLPFKEHTELYERYEKAIDGVAKKHLDNMGFMKYLESRIPHIGKEESIRYLIGRYPKMEEVEFARILGSP